MSNKLSYNTGSNGTYTFSHDELVRMFEFLSLSVRMRAAADVVKDAQDRLGSGNNLGAWDHMGLRCYAQQWEREDAEKSKRDSEIREMATVLLASRYPAASAPIKPSPAGGAMKEATALYNAGYRKQESA